MHIYFGERMLKGYCFPFLVRNCISYERIQYINDIYKIQYTLLSSIWFVKIVKISTNLKEESKEREGGREEEIGLKIVFQTQTLLPRGFQKKWQSAWNQTVERGEGGTGKKHRSRGIRARWTCWDLFRLVQVHWSDPGPGLWKKIMHGSTEREKKKGQKGGVGASFAPLEIARGAVSTPRFYVSKRINDHPAVNHTSLEKAP